MKLRLEQWIKKLKTFDQITECLIEVMRDMYCDHEDKPFHKNTEGPTVILMVGVNGSGKNNNDCQTYKKIFRKR